MKKVRLDQLVFDQGLSESRERAKAIIMSGVVYVNGQRADKPGALQMILSEFAYAGINLTMLQSRPTKKQLGDYMFFVELDGSMHDIDVQTALDCLRLKLREVKVLGSYPVE